MGVIAIGLLFNDCVGYELQTMYIDLFMPLLSFDFFEKSIYVLLHGIAVKYVHIVGTKY